MILRSTAGGLAKATMGRIPFGPNALRVSEWAQGLLHGAGLPDRTVAFAIDLLSLYVGAHAMEEGEGTLASPTEDTADPQEVLEMYRAYFESLPPETFPNTLALMDVLFEGDVDARFEFGLEVLVSGLAATAPRTK